MSECDEKMNKHWEFLVDFAFEMFPLDTNKYPAEWSEYLEKLQNMELGFKMAWPHAWKHGVKEFWDQYKKEDKT